MKGFWRYWGKRKPKSIFRIFFLSYLVILLIPIMLGIISYRNSAVVLKEQMGVYNVSLLDQTRQVFDTYLYGVDQLMNNLSLDETILDFLHSKLPMSPRDQYAMSRAVRSLSTLMNTNDFISNLFVYCRGTDAVLTPTGKYTPELYFGQEASYMGTNVDEIVSSLQLFSYKTFRSAEGTGAAQNQRYLLYLNSLPLNQKNEPLGTAVVEIDMNKLEAFLQNADMLDQGAAYVIDGNGQTIFGVGDEKWLSGIDWNRADGKRFFFTRTNEGQNIIVSYSQSTLNNWKYVSVIPSDIVLKKVNYIKNWTIVITLVELALGGLLSVYLARRNYIPIKQLADKLKLKVQGNFSGLNNELAFIESAAEAAVGESAKMKGIFEMQRPVMRVTVLNRLLNANEVMVAGIKDSLGSLGIHFKGDIYAVLNIGIEHYRKSISPDTYEQQSIIRFVIVNAYEELLKGSYTAYGFETVGDELAVIVNMTETPPDYLESMYEISQQVKRFVEQKFHTLITIGIGGTHQGVEGLARSYGESKKSLEYRIVKGRGSITAFAELTDRPVPFYAFPVQTEASILQCVKAGDMEKVNELLNGMFLSDHGGASMTIEEAKCMFMHLVSTGLKVLGETIIDSNKVFGDNFQPVVKILSCTTVVEIQTTLHTIFGKICLYMAENKKSHNDELKEKIIEYIYDHTADTNLSLSSVAAFLHMNPSYLSHFFKQQTGENFIEFVNKTRLEKVKSLLRTSKLPLSDICSRTGFSSPATLIRVFKKLNGVTPGQYREGGFEPD
ncbi:helix-turn-helix domain-containing protein [Cohnella zeiphila]|uniref:Helix-turn-helix domain-containing protein n=1 Tax=Cohnella zeiphila TaxID=2761120 RepID=A0A7X0SH76_9BACL|nr:helix-turn-helix domain-containing protein [Cohnella zeiphila]MBB6729791.1 helix-turn-helix domain-containing protein [Cohnella zeiphila]